MNVEWEVSLIAIACAHRSTEFLASQKGNQRQEIEWLACCFFRASNVVDYLSKSSSCELINLFHQSVHSCHN